MPQNKIKRYYGSYRFINQSQRRSLYPKNMLHSTKNIYPRDRYFESNGHKKIVYTNGTYVVTSLPTPQPLI